MTNKPTTNEDILKVFEVHVKEDHDNFNKGNDNFKKLDRVIFGDESIGEIGMKKKVDAIYDILTQSRGVFNFLGGVRGTLLFFITIGAVVAMLKGWFK